MLHRGINTKSISQLQGSMLHYLSCLTDTLARLQPRNKHLNHYTVAILLCYRRRRLQKGNDLACRVVRHLRDITAGLSVNYSLSALYC